MAAIRDRDDLLDALTRAACVPQARDIPFALASGEVRSDQHHVSV